MNPRQRCQGAALRLVLVAACTACALQETAPPAPGLDLRPPLGAHPGQPRGPQYLAPKLGIGPEGDVYLAWLAFEPTKSWDVLISRSQDDGATWSNPARSLNPERNIIAGGIGIAADPRGDVYVTWRHRDQLEKTRKLLFVRSGNRAMEWKEPIHTLSRSNDLHNPQLVAEPGGKVYVAWQDGPEISRWLNIALSTDFGATFDQEPIRLNAVDPHASFAISKPHFTADGEGHLYVVWEEAKTLQDLRIYLSRSSDGGKSWAREPALLNVPDPKTSGARSPEIHVAPKGRVYVLWEQSENRMVDPKEPNVVRDTDRMIYFNRSLDYGETWLPQPIRLNEAGPEPVIALQARVSSDLDGTVYATWTEVERNHARRVLFTRSTDSGVTWDAPRERLDLTSPFRSRVALPQIRSDAGGHVWVLWQELAPFPTGWTLLMNRSSDRGRTWLRKAVSLVTPPQRRGSFRGVDFKTDPRGHLYVACDGGNDNDRELYFNRSTDFGATWLSREIRMGVR